MMSSPRQTSYVIRPNGETTRWGSDEHVSDLAETYYRLDGQPEVQAILLRYSSPEVVALLRTHGVLPATTDD